jgi:hypothetical protein
METSGDEKLIENIKNELTKYSPKTKGRIIEKIILAALGSIPWIRWTALLYGIINEHLLQEETYEE